MHAYPRVQLFVPAAQVWCGAQSLQRAQMLLGSSITTASAGKPRGDGLAQVRRQQLADWASSHAAELEEMRARVRALVAPEGAS